MESSFVRMVSGKMAALSELSGLPVVWKNADANSEPELPYCQARHANPFCAGVKMEPRRCERCVLNDRELVATRAGLGKGGFLINRCHAGVDELVAPVFVGDYYRGVFFLGPFRSEGAGCAYPVNVREFAALPAPSPERLEAAGQLLRLLADLVGREHRTVASRRSASVAGDSPLGPALEHIQNHFDEPLDAAGLAARCHLSQSRFLHLFKERCGTGLVRHLTARRLEEAKLLLAGTELEVGEIARRCGFESQSYFGLVFRREVGCSPGDHRRRGRRTLDP